MRLLKTALPVTLITLLLVFTLAGCAKPPTAEMDAAEAAYTQASNDPDAAAYAESTLSRAKDALQKMRSEAAAKRYDSAKSFAAEVSAASSKALSDGKAAAQRAKEEAAGLIAAVKTSLTETVAAFEKARLVDRLQLDYDTLGRDLDTARNSVSQAETAFNTGKYKDAKQRSESARSLLGNIMSTISTGVRSVTRKK